MHMPLKHEILPLKIFTKEILKIFSCWQHYGLKNQKISYCKVKILEKTQDLFKYRVEPARKLGKSPGMKNKKEGESSPVTTELKL